nr:Ycf60 [Ochrosphaera neapolitana]
MFKDKISQRVIPLFAYLFPILEIIYYFGLKLCFGLESPLVKMFCLMYILPIRSFYEQNLFLVFGLMVAIFTMCSKGSIPLPKFIRFNIIQAILLSIAISCLGQIYSLCPLQVRESYLLTNLVVNPIALSLGLIVIYACVLILAGRYSRFPILSEAAKLQTQRGYSDE